MEMGCYHHITGTTARFIPAFLCAKSTKETARALRIDGEKTRGAYEENLKMV